MPIRHIFPLLSIILFLALNTAASSAELEAARLREAEAALSSLGYWVLNVDGKPDASTSHAIAAFQKVEGLKRTGKLTPDVLEAIRYASRPAAQFDTNAAHVEVDMKRQVLYFVDDQNNVTRILAVSTGSEQKYVSEGTWDIAHTPRGTFRIYSKIDGVRHAPLGDIYYPSYFSGGVAIHGSNSIPFSPASHGCVRIPRYADQAFGSLTRVGMEVYVYDNYFLTRAPGQQIVKTALFSPREGRLFEGGNIFENAMTAGLYDQNWRQSPAYAFNPGANVNSFTAMSTLPLNIRPASYDFSRGLQATVNTGNSSRSGNNS